MSDLDFQYYAELVICAQNGESDAFAELYAATYQKQYRFAYKYLRDEYLAQDAIQDSYTLALKNISTLRDPQLFLSWLNQINLRVCFSMHQNQKLQAYELVNLNENTDFSSDYTPTVSPETMTINVDEKEYILRQILTLPFAESQAILLKYYDDLKVDEIAELMDISRSSVKRYLANGKRKLAKLLKH